MGLVRTFVQKPVSDRLSELGLAADNVGPRDVLRQFAIGDATPDRDGYFAVRLQLRPLRQDSSARLGRPQVA
jgi:hypothetical protein